MNKFFTSVVTEAECTIRTEDCETKLNTFSRFFCPAGAGEYTTESDQEVHILEWLPPE